MVAGATCHKVTLPADMRLEIEIALVANRIRGREQFREGRPEGADALRTGRRFVQQTADLDEARAGLVLARVIAVMRAETGADQSPATHL